MIGSVRVLVLLLAFIVTASAIGYSGGKLLPREHLMEPRVKKLMIDFPEANRVEISF